MPDRLDPAKMIQQGVELVYEERLEPTERGVVGRSPFTRDYADLSEMAEHLVLFAASAMYHCIALPQDPFQTWLERVNLSEDRRPRAVDLTWEVFGGMRDEVKIGGETIPLRRRIFACPKETWPDCRVQLGGISVYDHKKRYYARTAWSTVAIVDRLRAKGPLDLPPTLVLESLAVASNEWTAALANTGSPHLVAPSLQYAPAQPTIVREAEQFFNSMTTRL